MGIHTINFTFTGTSWGITYKDTYKDCFKPGAETKSTRLCYGLGVGRREAWERAHAEGTLSCLK
jgi:hypothetical protein